MCAYCATASKVGISRATLKPGCGPAWPADGIPVRRSVAGLVQRDNICTAQPEAGSKWRAPRILLTLHGNVHDPRPCTRRVHYEVKPVAVAIPTRPQILNQLFRQLPSERRASYRTLYHPKYGTR